MAFDRDAALAAGYSAAEIDAYLAKQSGQPQPAAPQITPQSAPSKVPQVQEPVNPNPGVLEDIGRTAPSSVVKGVVGALTAPRSVSDLLDNILGTNSQNTGGTPWPGYTQSMSAVKDYIPGGLYDPKTVPGQFADTAIQMGVTAPLGPGRAGVKALQWGLGSLGSEGAAQTFGDSPGTRIAGSVIGAGLPGAVRRIVTPNPYNPKDLAAYNANRADIAANTAMTETPEFQRTVAALKRGKNPIDFTTYTAESFAKLTPQQQAAARRAGSPPAPAYTGSGKPPPAPPPSWTGDQFAHMQDALARDIAKAGPVEKRRLVNLKTQMDQAMETSQVGKSYAGAWDDLAAQRAGLDEGVEKSINKGGLMGKGTGALLGGLAGTAAAAAGAKMGLPVSAVLEALLATAGAGLGVTGRQAIKGKTTKLTDALIPGLASYRRNQMWQPSDLTTMNKGQQLRMLSSGELLPSMLPEEQ